MTDLEHSVARLAGALEHTLLRPDASASEIDTLCELAVAYGAAGVCVSPTRVASCRARLATSAVRVVTVVGFPSGTHRSEVKALEARLAVDEGADELDMVIDLGAARDARWNDLVADVAAVVSAARGRPVKAILETSLLDEAQKREAGRCALSAGAMFLKTSTGTAGGATVDDVRLLRELAGERAFVKASGGIRDAADALTMLEAGADRIGTSSAVRIVTQLRDLAMLHRMQEGG